MNVIRGFQDEYRWLSNFHLVVVRFDNHKYPSVENAYQAAKTIDYITRMEFNYVSPARAKQLGKTVVLRADWDQVKLNIMLELLREKFKHPKLAKLLRATGDSYIEETNTWGDTFWGVCNGVGNNHLGKLLMQVRSEVN